MVGDMEETSQPEALVLRVMRPADFICLSGFLGQTLLKLNISLCMDKKTLSKCVSVPNS